MVLEQEIEINQAGTDKAHKFFFFVQDPGETYFASFYCRTVKGKSFMLKFNEWQEEIRPAAWNETVKLDVRRGVNTIGVSLK